VGVRCDVDSGLWSDDSNARTGNCMLYTFCRCLEEDGGAELGAETGAGAGAGEMALGLKTGAPSRW
jgi:hypothetical protein